MVKRRHSGLKDRCIKFYDEYQGDKVYFSTFYSRVRLDPEGDMEYAIKPRERRGKKRISTTITGVYAEEMRRWYDQKEPKASRQVFYGRIRIGYPKEQAILTGEKWQKVLAEKPIKKKSGYKCHTITKQEKEHQEEAYTGVDITYPKEVARVFRKEYQRMIDDLERQLTMIDEKTAVKETSEKLDLIKAELEVFNRYNK